jgi:hypothetical protein
VKLKPESTISIHSGGDIPSPNKAPWGIRYAAVSVVSRYGIATILEET